jgi:hypothetical protein
MQFRIAFAVLVYVGSYLPLSVILLVQDIDASRYRQPFCFAPGGADCAWPMAHPGFAVWTVLGCSLCFLLTLIALASAAPKQRVVLKAVEHVPADLMNYVLPYIVSLIGLDYADKSKLLGFVVFFTWMFVISYRSGLIILNPVLTVFGWRLYEVTYTYDGGDGHEYQGHILSNATLEMGGAYPQAAIQDVLVVKKT